MNKLFLDILTGVDGKSFDIVKVLMIPITLVFLGLAIWDFYFNHKFDMMNFGLAIGTIITAVGGSLKLKETTEPKAEIKIPNKVNKNIEEGDAVEK